MLPIYMIGIGANPVVSVSNSKYTENCRVYVSGFPTDITEEDVGKTVFYYVVIVVFMTCNYFSNFSMSSL